MARLFNKEAQEAHKIAIGKRLFGIRDIRGYTQEEVAEKAQTSQSAYAKWENGGLFPNPTCMIGACAFLEIDFNYIYQGDFGCFDGETAARLAVAHPEIVPPSARKNRSPEE